MAGLFVFLWLAITIMILAKPMPQNSDGLSITEPLPGGELLDTTSFDPTDEPVLSDASTGTDGVGCTPDASENSPNLSVSRRDVTMCPATGYRKTPEPDHNKIKPPSTSGQPPDHTTGQHHNGDGDDECLDPTQSELLTCAGPEIWDPPGIYYGLVVNCVDGKILDANEPSIQILTWMADFRG